MFPQTRNKTTRPDSFNQLNTIDSIVPDTPCKSLNFNTTLQPQEINRLRDNLIQNIGFLNLNRRKIRPNEYTTLFNYHQYALDTFNNMLKIQEVSARNPFGTAADNPVEDLVYNEKGILEQRPKRQFKEEWEHQFDSNLVNPPCYTLPPSGCFKPNGL